MIAISAAFAQNIVLTKGVFLSEISLDRKYLMTNTLFVALTGILAAFSAWLSLVIIPFNAILNRSSMYAIGILFYAVLVVGIFYLYNYIANRYSLGKLISKPLLYFGFYPVAIIITVISNGMYFVESIGYSIGSGLGLYIITFNMIFIRIRLEEINMPRYFRGLPITLIVFGIISMALFCLVGKTINI